MSLTLGHGPLSTEPAISNYRIGGPAHRLFIEDCEKRVRVQFGDQFVVDTRAAKMLHETGLLPVYYFPLRDVRVDLLSRTGCQTTCPFKGRASHFTVRAGRKVAENVAWAYPEPMQEVRVLADRVAFYLERADAIYEEDERLVGRPHDPYHRVDVQRSSRKVHVLVNGEAIAETSHPLAVFETGLPVRWYVPIADVRRERLLTSAKRTICPYKGVATYWSLRGGSDAIAWSYDEPLPEGSGLTGHLSFDGEGVVVVVDDEPVLVRERCGFNAAPPL